MKRILISQRRDPVPNRDEERDSMDVRIAKMVFDLGYLPIPLCSELFEAENYIEAFGADAVLLNSGNDIGEHPQRDQLEIRLLNYAKEQQLPVFAICRGTQMINHYCGGSLVPVTGHVATRHKLKGEWAKQQGYSDVNSYHDFAITKATLGANLEVLATTADGVIKAIKHKSYPWLGIMWHPEREPSMPEADKRLFIKALRKY